MKRQKKSRSVLMFIVLGLLVTSSATLLHTHYPDISDFFYGSVVGIGLGIMISALIFHKKGMRKGAVRA